MNCINFSIRPTQASLLTQAAKIAALEKEFSKYRRKADVFLPDTSFYADVTNPVDVDRMATALFRWLGIKHYSLEFRIDPNELRLVSYTHKNNTPTVILGRQCQKNAYVCAGALAHAIAHHLLMSRSKLAMSSPEDNEELADLATIYLGLGVLVINSLKTTKATLGSMAPANYIAESQDFFAEHGVVASLWQPYVLPGSLSLPRSRKSRSASQPITHSRHKLLFAATVLLSTGALLIIK